MSYLALYVPRTGVEPARLAALAPETSASTIPPPGLSPQSKPRCTTPSIAADSLQGAYNTTSHAAA